MNSTISFHVPGKLMLSGEWNILTPGRSCITLPTKGIHVSIEPAKLITITSPAYGLFSKPYETLKQESSAAAIFLKTIIETALDLVKKNTTLQPFHITLINDPLTYVVKNKTTLKLGIGSSACTAVGIIKAVALFHNIPLKTEALFMFAAQAHFNAQFKLGSGFDIAAAAAGKPIMYTSHKLPPSLKNEYWSAIKINPIFFPKNWLWAIGFSGTSAHTPDLIRIFNKKAQEKNLCFEQVLEQIESIVQSLVIAIKEKNIFSAMDLITQNQDQLDILSKLCGNTLTTEPLKDMVNLAMNNGAAAKFSGAGGGDCVIALCPSQEIKENVDQSWQAAGFTPIKELLIHAN